MARSEALATDLTSRISKRYVDKQYADIDKRQRGVQAPMNFNVTNILLEDLRQNSYTETLTEEERDTIIDKLII